MNGEPFKGARRRINPEVLDIFYPPPPPSDSSWAFQSSNVIAFQSGNTIALNNSSNEDN